MEEAKSTIASTATVAAVTAHPAHTVAAGAVAALGQIHVNSGLDQSQPGVAVYAAAKSISSNGIKPGSVCALTR